MQEPTYTHQQILRVITGIMLCILLAAMDQTVVVPAVPAIAAQLGGFGHLAWIVSAYLLTSTAVTPVYGKMSDMYGRRRLLLLALSIFIAASVLCALAQSLPQLIAFRALQGLGGGGLMAIVQAAIADVVAPRERGRYQGYMASMWAVASVGGPVVGGWFTDHLSWTFVFWINLPLGLAAMWLCDRALRLLPVHGTGGRIDYWGAALLSGAVTALLLVLSWGGRTFAWGSAPVLGLLAVSGALLVLLVRHERDAADAILPPRLFAHAVFARGVAVSFLLAIVLLGTTVLLPLYFQLDRGAGASASGLLVMPFLAFNVVGALSGGQASRYLGRTKGLIVGGLGATTLGFAALAAIGAATPLALVMLAMAVSGFGLGVCMPNTLVTVQNAAERRDVGAATGALLFLRSMGGAFGSTLVATLLAGTFAARVAAAGFPGVRDLGALRPGGALLTMGPAAEAAGRAALSGGFHIAFLACAASSGLALLVALGLHDLPLRTSAVAAPAPAEAAAE
jgi:EmrB/QacA subfamily drug resistance transporter